MKVADCPKTLAIICQNTQRQ